MSAIITMVLANKAVILGFLFLFSEALASIPFIKANGIFQAIFNAIKWAKEKFGTEAK